MIRSGLAFIALGLLAMFGYFFVMTPGDRPGGDRAKQAAVELGDAVVDQSAAGLVRARLATSLGLDGVRFLHVHYDDGKVLIYGLAPARVTADGLAGLVRGIPGVRTVDVQIMTRPTYLDVLAPGPAGGGVH
jgi:hypothetical protein